MWQQINTQTKCEDSVLLCALLFNFLSLFVGEMRECSGSMQVGLVGTDHHQDLKVDLFVSHGEDLTVVSRPTGRLDKFMVKPRILTSVGPQVNQWS